MPKMKISEGIANGLRLVDSLFETMLNDATVTSSSTTSATLQLGTSTITLTGTGLQFGTTDQDTSLVSGTLDSVLYTYKPGYYAAFTQLGFDVAPLSTAAQAEKSGGDPGALEALLYPLDWRIITNSSADNFVMGQLSNDGVAISYDGNNNVRLRYGSDRFDAGDGDDIVRGGGSDDVIWGGTGRDKIIGGRGNDTLMGQAGRDKLFGGLKHDDLQGGRGKDVLNGGMGDDDLTGGSGADRFVFTPAMLAENDTIHDFEVGQDRIVIRTNGGISTVDTAAGFDITDGLRTIHVTGVSVDNLTGDDLIVVGV